MEASSAINYTNFFKETLEVLKHFDSEFLSKIPNEFLSAMKEFASKSTITVNIDTSKNLIEQDISEECKEMISLIFYSYIATKEEKEELTELWNVNEEAYQKGLKEKYNVDNIFENSKKAIETESAENSKKELVEYKEKNFFQKIIEKIKNWFIKK